MRTDSLTPVENSETTLRQIAEVAGVARSTVSRALQNHPRIGKETRERIHRIAEELGYRRDAYLSELMVRLRHRKESADRPVIAMIHWQNFGLERNPVKGYWSMTQGAWQRALEYGYKPEVFNISEFEGHRRNILEVLRARGIRGGVLIPPQHPAPLPDLPWDYLSIVAIGPSIFSEHLHRSTPNHRQCMRESLNRLASLGYKRIAFALTPTVKVRSEGLFEATYLLAEYNAPGLMPCPPLVISMDEEERFMHWYEKVLPDAIICGSTFEMISGWLAKRGIRAPEHIGLANLQLYQQDRESGIWQNAPQVGAGAIDLLKNLLEENETGLPAIARTLSFSGDWVDGYSTREQ